MALWATFAAADSIGSATGLPLPRYASLKTDRVNLREGPSKDRPHLVVLRLGKRPQATRTELATKGLSLDENARRFS